MGEAKGGSAERPSDGFSSQSAAPSLPRVFGRLILLKLIARGGMGDVCLAATTGIEGAERACIVKTVRRDHIHDGSFLARFLDEARVQSQLNHPGVAQVLEASTDANGEPYTVVEYVEGRSLADVRQRGVQLGTKIEWADAVALAIEMAQALAHVHERSGSDGAPLGIVHRDLSPQNVMVGYAGEVKLIDFGTARGQNRRCHTVAGVVFAKPGYVAPEVARQQIGDGRIDVYALGIMLWELCKGARFLNGDPQRHLEEAAAGRVIVPPIASSVDAPPLLDEVIQRLTANEPDDRFASAARAVPELARLLAMAPSPKSGERGVRVRVAALMRTLWPHEPGRSRAEFAKLLREARHLHKEAATPSAAKVVEAVAARMTPEDPSVLAGTSYRLVRKIGEGASGVVWEAEHVELGRKLAIKILTATHASASDSIERFRREARALAKLSHPNLVGLYDFGKSLDGRVFLAMELLHGETLDKRIKRVGAVHWRDAALLGIEVAKALEAAHSASLVHRDLKPANLFLTGESSIKLLDFGVAMALADTISDEAEKRQKGFAIFGTPEYMAPEQVAGEAVDGRCDLYALGCVLYELVTGVRVFEGTSSVVVMGKQLREFAESPRARAPSLDIPFAIDHLIMKALSKRPDERFPSAAAMREALEATLVIPVKQRARSRQILVAALSATALVAIAGGTARWVAAKGGVSALIAETTESTPATLAQTAEEDDPDPDLAPPTANAVSANVIGASANVIANQSTTADTSADATQTGEAPMSRAARGHALVQARARVKGHMSDASLLKAWATAAFRAGDMREAKRAGHAWGLHDTTVEPRMFLANVLDASGHRAQAMLVLEDWQKLHPDDQDVRGAIARIKAERGRAPAQRTSQLARK